MSKTIKYGSVVKIWHKANKGCPRKGHDYVAVGSDANHLYLLKTTALNNDGTIHKAVKKCHKRKTITSIAADVSLVKGVTRVGKVKDLSAWKDSIITLLPSGASLIDEDTSFIG